MEGSIRSINTNYFYWFELDGVTYNATTQRYMDYGYGGGGGMTTVVSIESTGEATDDKDIMEYAEKFLLAKMTEKKSISIIGDNNCTNITTHE